MATQQRGLGSDNELNQRKGEAHRMGGQSHSSPKRRDQYDEAEIKRRGSGGNTDSDDMSEVPDTDTNGSESSESSDERNDMYGDVSSRD
jgi:hypothetical protein